MAASCALDHVQVVIGTPGRVIDNIKIFIQFPHLYFLKTGPFLQIFIYCKHQLV